MQRIFLNTAVVFMLSGFPVKASHLEIDHENFNISTSRQRVEQIKPMYHPEQLNEARDLMKNANSRLDEKLQNYFHELIEVEKGWAALRAPFTFKAVAGIGVMCTGYYLENYAPFLSKVLSCAGIALAGSDMAEQSINYFILARRNKQLTQELQQIEKAFEEDKIFLATAYNWPTPQHYQAYIMGLCLHNSDYKKYLPAAQAPPLQEVAKDVHLALTLFLHWQHLNQENFNDHNARQSYEMFAAWGVIRYKDIDAYYHRKYGRM